MLQSLDAPIALSRHRQSTSCSVSARPSLPVEEIAFPNQSLGFRFSFWLNLPCSVTEAGEGEDGRMKSAIGIGALLMDGLGDTIRVSLTEDPELEMEPCRSGLFLQGTYIHGFICLTYFDWASAWQHAFYGVSGN